MEFHSLSHSPLFAQSNGLAEKYVQIMKHLFEKAKADKRDPYISILEYRNCPLECDYSLLQLLNSRRYCSILPPTNKQLLPRTVDASKVQKELHKCQERQKYYFDVDSKPLKPLKVGESVRLKHNRNMWQDAVVTSKHADRSYSCMSCKLSEAENKYRRNMRLLQKTGESHKLGLYDDLKQFETILSVPEVQSDVPVTKSTEMSIQNVSQNSSPKSIASGRNSIPSGPKFNPFSQPYFTLFFGRAVKPNVIVSM